MSEDTQVEVIADASQNQQTEYTPEVVEVETEEGQEQASEQTQDTPKDEEPEWFKKKIGKLTAQKHAEAQARQEVQRIADEANRRASELERRLQELETPKIDPQYLPENERIAYYAQQELRKSQQAQQAQYEQNQRAQELAKRHIDNVVKAKENPELADYDEVINEAIEAGLRIPTNTISFIQESDFSAELTYHLAKNPMEALKLSNMNEREQERFLTKLETKIELKKELAPIKQSKAPSPIAKVGSQGVSKTNTPPMDGDAYWAYYQAQKRKK